MQSHMPTNWQKIEEKVSVAPTYPLSVTITYAISDNVHAVSHGSLRFAFKMVVISQYLTVLTFFGEYWTAL